MFSLRGLFLLAEAALTVNLQMIPLDAMRGIKCVIPKGGDHVTRALLLQQCLSNNYGQGNETQCYPELGCFSMDYPWTSLLRPFPTPLPPPEINVQFHCYSRDVEKRNVVFLWPFISLRDCQFSASRKTVFITHGFASNVDFPWIIEMKDRYLKLVDANVFLVDWGRGAQLLNYLQVASNTRIVGAELARFIKFLQDNHGLKPENLHLIGHSLGAQISGYVGKRVPGIAQITALDPAQPGFEWCEDKVKLHISDATFIDVLHTNGLPFLPTLGFGMTSPHGHVDIYMNGGLTQPGCLLPNITDIKSIEDLEHFTVEAIMHLACCSHCRAVEYYNQVLDNNCSIWARVASIPSAIISVGTMGFVEPLINSLSECEAETCTQLGLLTSKFKARGVFTASTPMTSPFCSDAATTKELLNRIGKNIFGTVHKITNAVVDVLNKTNFWPLRKKKQRCIVGVCL